MDWWLQVTTRCIWRIILPLLDMGYQVDIRLMDSVHYGVPQMREVSPLPLCVTLQMS